MILLCSPLSAQAEQRILLLGDSLSAAYRIPVDQSWPRLLADALPDGTRLINASVSGETTAGGLARLPALLAEHSADLLIIELGGNDGLRGYPLTGIRRNLQKMITLGQQSGARVMLIGMHIPPNYGRKYSEGFFQNYADLAKANDLPLVPFLLEGVATESKLMQSDGIHPTAKAQGKILDNVLPVLEPLL